MNAWTRLIQTAVLVTGTWQYRAYLTHILSADVPLMWISLSLYERSGFVASERKKPCVDAERWSSFLHDRASVCRFRMVFFGPVQRASCHHFSFSTPTFARNCPYFVNEGKLLLIVGAGESPPDWRMAAKENLDGPIRPRDTITVNTAWQTPNTGKVQRNMGHCVSYVGVQCTIVWARRL